MVKDLDFLWHQSPSFLLGALWEQKRTMGPMQGWGFDG